MGQKFGKDAGEGFCTDAIATSTAIATRISLPAAMRYTNHNVPSIAMALTLRQIEEGHEAEYVLELDSISSQDA